MGLPHTLEVDSVIKSYGVRRVLAGVYLTCQTGEIVGVLGRNGCGKSTLLRAVFGTLEAQGACVKIDGVRCERAYMTGLLCYLPQGSFLPKDLSARGAVRLYFGRAKSAAFFDDEFLRPLAAATIARLSVGERRYLEIKLLAGTAAPFLLLDEPFSGLSPLVVSRVKALLREAARTKGIILTDHDYRSVLDLATRCALLSGGTLHALSGAEQLVCGGYLPAGLLTLPPPPD